MTKAAFITGASRGIGAGIARTLAEQGYDLAITYSSKEEEARELQREVEAMGRRCFVYQASLEERDVPEAVTKQAIRDLGRIDTLVCNAGLTRLESLMQLTDEIFDLLVNLNFRAYVYCSRTIARHMIKHGIRGSIIYISSTHGSRAYQRDGMYGALKAALNRIVESFALDLAPYGIRINSVAPGATQVRFGEDLKRGNWYDAIGPRIPLGRVGQPNEIGEAVAFFADEARSGYITGQTLRIDGGLIIPGMPEHPEAPPWIYGKVEKDWDDDDL